jgi:hypothetical protein
MTGNRLKSILFKNISHFACVFAFFVVPLYVFWITTQIINTNIKKYESNFNLFACFGRNWIGGSSATFHCRSKIQGRGRSTH